MALTNRTYISTTMPPARWPDPASIDPATLLLDYDSTVDSLAVAFDGTVRPAAIDPIDGRAGRYVSLRIDLDSDEEVVGIEIESVSAALAEHPAWRAIVDAASSVPGWHRGKPSEWSALADFVAEVADLSGAASGPSKTNPSHNQAR